MTSGAVTDGGNTRVLADSHKLPMLGLGVWQVPNGSECVSTVRSALDVGYRHIDTAQAYGNEESVGRALRESDIPREELFITTKFYPESADPSAEAEHSLRRLRLDYVDLYIIHWPKGGATWAWPGMEKAHERGHARSIGVSNIQRHRVGRGECGCKRRACRQPGAVQPVRVSQRAARRLPAAQHRAGGLQPPRRRRSSLQPGDRCDRQAPRSHAGTGTAAVVPPA